MSEARGPAGEDQATTSVEGLYPDKRDQEPPDSTSKIERKMLKTSEASVGSQAGGPYQQGTAASASASARGFFGFQIQTDPETIAISAEFYNSMPELRMKLCNS